LGQPEKPVMGGQGKMPYFDNLGETLTDIARRYNVHPSTISRLTA
jgi:hypothetical protein